MRASEHFGIPAWLGAVIRANDKMSRIKSFAERGVLANEPIEDSLIDLANYAVIALVLYREADDGKEKLQAMDSSNLLIKPTLLKPKSSPTSPREISRISTRYPTGYERLPRRLSQQTLT